ncbi:tyrosine-type recombinase/integrase [Amycolatopsis sp. NPDC088138]|uniref:tyrosine-type recombinase/integrase n=1 Tax=Amycolatopsis sp. NPDC088138 TaxID=3363938 RepID=UPI00383044A9
MDERKLSDNYQAVLFNTVSGVMDSAVDDRRIRENPCHAKTVRRPVASSPPVVVWPEERIQAVRSGLADRFKIAVPLGAGFGLRQGEILGFSPDDVDRTAMTVRIRRQIKTVKGVMMFALPKRAKERTIPLSVAMLAEIDGHEDRFPSVAVTLPWQSADGEPVTARLLMTGEGGRLYSGDLFTKVVWHGAFRASGVEYRRRADGMHALRHFYASTLLARAVSIAELADYLGHADPGFTLRTYTHLVPSSHQRARKAVDAVFGRPAFDDGLEAA